MEHANNYRSKALLFVYLLIAVLLHLSVINVCRGAPVLSSSTQEFGANDNETSSGSSSGSVAEQQGDEFADLQQLRSGLKVLNTIAVSE